MKTPNFLSALTRRNFFGTLSSGLTSIVATPIIVTSNNESASGLGSTHQGADAEEWFKKIKGKQRIVYDATSVHDGFSIVWSWVFLDSNNKSGSSDDELTTMVVFRHNAFALALGNEIWSSFKFGKRLKILDPVTGVPVTKNPYWDPPKGHMPEAGMSIKLLMERGAMFCVCERSLSVNSATFAANKKMDKEQVTKEWIDGLLPGIQVVPSGVWAIDRAQQNGCSYCFAG